VNTQHLKLWQAIEGTQCKAALGQLHFNNKTPHLEADDAPKPALHLLGCNLVLGVTFKARVVHTRHLQRYRITAQYSAVQRMLYSPMRNSTVQPRKHQWPASWRIYNALL